VEIVCYVVTAFAAYLLGSIPTGFLVAQTRGIDIRTVGSGNIGATNTLRVLGKPAGIFVLLMDALKGWLAVVPLAFIIATLFRQPQSGTSQETAQIIAGLCVILGHNYTCWLQFKGGKGIATSAGVRLALVPWALLIIFTVFVVCLLLTRYVSVGSIAAAATLPFASWITGESTAKIIITGAMSVLAIYKHKENINRLLKGTERRLGATPKEEAK
jgi:acyl phosphate:glycerol-3-phosphate acyltransferase